MSYKKKREKKNIISQLKRQIGLIKIVLFKKTNYFTKKEVNMQQRQTRTIMQWLRERSKIIRQNNLKINEWVEKYIDDCILNGKSIEILTQYCLSKDLEKRYKIQGNKFIPLQAENKMFCKDIPLILDEFKNNGISVNWFITFNNSFMEQGMVDKKIANDYIAMINGLVQNDEVLLLHWENDVLKERPAPNQDVLDNFYAFISEEAYGVAMDDLTKRTVGTPNFNEIKKGFDGGLKFKISCEVEEGRMLINDEIPLFEEKGKFILVPLELPERFVFFETLAPGFQKRIVPILKPYPWRIDGSKIEYD
ncbi:hypothetical protein A2997_00875 [Candidatus Nomurabacteria bacterium RIFCSPLOWO2_01_FULL_36_10b]|uniref:Uncharacterized protein n=1 Tax=Candidatus Nomurabacteria bacterium RIFCSPLOWO2_01_FULL_36_10b TaxID=1801766 RepID=A0A1F6WQ54_9BACT|nr:MAG: hypothetical protein A2997_00875 [Candidatus Nomurabacteria bacterium RIFCSPLOWO2_01_FULL_36_10b]